VVVRLLGRWFLGFAFRLNLAPPWSYPWPFPRPFFLLFSPLRLLRMVVRVGAPDDGWFLWPLVSGTISARCRAPNRKAPLFSPLLLVCRGQFPRGLPDSRSSRSPRLLKFGANASGPLSSHVPLVIIFFARFFPVFIRQLMEKPLPDERPSYSDLLLCAFFPTPISASGLEPEPRIFSFFCLGFCSVCCFFNVVPCPASDLAYGQHPARG